MDQGLVQALKADYGHGVHARQTERPAPEVCERTIDVSYAGANHGLLPCCPALSDAFPIGYNAGLH